MLVKIAIIVNPVLGTNLVFGLKYKPSPGPCLASQGPICSSSNFHSGKG